MCSSDLHSSRVSKKKNKIKSKDLFKLDICNKKVRAARTFFYKKIIVLRFVLGGIRLIKKVVCDILLAYRALTYELTEQKALIRY